MEKKKVIGFIVIGTVIGYASGMCAGAFICKPKAPVVVDAPVETVAPVVPAK